MRYNGGLLGGATAGAPVLRPRQWRVRRRPSRQQFRDAQSRAQLVPQILRAVRRRRTTPPPSPSSSSNDGGAATISSTRVKSAGILEHIFVGNRLSRGAAQLENGLDRSTSRRSGLRSSFSPATATTSRRPSRRSIGSSTPMWTSGGSKSVASASSTWCTSPSAISASSSLPRSPRKSTPRSSPVN